MKRKPWFWLLPFFALLTSTLPAQADKKDSKRVAPLETVAHVELEKYAGKWFEIASIPQPFSKNCFGSTAKYTLRADGQLSVLNECHKNSFDGKISQVKGHAWVVDKKTNAKLKVSFFWPFRGNYWIIDLDENYKWAVVAHPNRKFLWILSRESQLDESTYQKIIEKLQVQQFDLQKIKRTPQPEHKSSSL